MSSKIYLDNIDRFRNFIGSDFYNFLNLYYHEYVNKVMKSLYVDPDRSDEELYRRLGEKYNLSSRFSYLVENINGHEIKLSADAICGWKQLSQVHPDPNQWLSDYKILRENLALHFIWPQHKLPTINTLRYTKFFDRIDLTLFDLKEFFNGKNTQLNNAYQNGSTSIWLSKFNGNFSEFIDKMRLNNFVNDEYEVLDIENRRESIITSIPTRSEIKDSIPRYIESLLSLVKGGKL